MGFITSPSPSNTTEGREGVVGSGVQRGREGGREVLASYNASNPHTYSLQLGITRLHDNRGEDKAKEQVDIMKQKSKCIIFMQQIVNQ